jgi:hypothetical protein
MSKYPKWIKLEYYIREPEECIMKYLGSVSNAKDLYEKFEKINLQASDIIFMYVDDKLQSKEDVLKFFDWLDKTREIYEKQT